MFLGAATIAALVYLMVLEPDVLALSKSELVATRSDENVPAGRRIASRLALTALGEDATASNEDRYRAMALLAQFADH